MTNMPNRLRRFTISLLLTFFCLGVVWACAVPAPIDGSPDLARWANFHPDEYAHIAVIRYMTNHHALPPYTLPYYESAHPPLYHITAATLWAVLAPALGAAGTIHALRLFGVTCGALLLYFVLQAARDTLPRRGMPIAGLTILMNPMLVSLSGAVTNEIFAAAACAGALAALVRGLRRGFGWRTTLALSFWTAVAVGSKVTSLGLLPVGCLGLIVAGQTRHTPARIIAAHVGLFVLLPALLSGWWYARNVLMYGDLFRQVAEERLLGNLIPGYAGLGNEWHISFTRYLVSVTGRGWLSFWGRFYASTFNLPPVAYATPLLVTIVGSGGLVTLLRRKRFRQRYGGGIACISLLALWVIAVYYRYNMVHYQPQGRFFFPLLLPYALFVGAGLLVLLRRRLHYQVLLGILIVSGLVLHGTALNLLAGLLKP